VGISWPREYGGRGASLTEQAIYNEETVKAGAPPPANFQGINNAGPAIILHGTEWQKDRYLGPILSAEEVWCQGFSEPEAGSDLAGLRSRARRVDGGWRISGQKTWTSTGHHAQMCILLARTSDLGSKHKGLTYFLMPMDQEEVQLRRIRQIEGNSEFNEMFLDDAFVADEDVLGAVDNGWNVAITTLAHERAGVGITFSTQARQWLAQLGEQMRDERVADPRLRARFAQLHIEVEALRLNVMRGFSSQRRHQKVGPETSLTKWQFSEVGAAIAALAADAFPDESVSMTSLWGYRLLRSMGMAIEGGTTEIQQNIIAERVLGLPRLR
jgi:alkylation response protein AidB-like acyl-CoA dehydrogenase